MLYPIEELIKGRDKPLCVKKDMRVGDAMALMMEHDYSQLPIVNDDGELTGIITEQSIINTYFNVGDKCGLLDMTIDHCRAKQTQISPQHDIFDALNLLKNVSAIVVVEDNKPVGIVTDYDTTVFFHNYSDGMILVQDVETTLKQYINDVLNTDKLMTDALKKSNLYNDDENRPPKTIDDLTFSDLVILIETKDTWSKFEPYFKNKAVFHGHMEKVRNVRNQLAHFRGGLTNLQRKQINQAIDWLDARPPTKMVVKIQETVERPIISIHSARTQGKFTPLEEWLTEEAKIQHTIGLKFEDFEKLIGEPLPDSARKHRAWWSNDYSHSHAAAWIRAGWLVKSVDINAEEIILKNTIQAQYIVFFNDILERIKKERPGITKVERVSSLLNYISIVSRGGCYFNWVLPKDHILRVEVYIDSGDKQRNIEIFESLKNDQKIIEQEIGKTLFWDMLGEAKAKRIFVQFPFHITRPFEEHEPAKQWGVEIMIKFVDVFLPKLRDI